MQNNKIDRILDLLKSIDKNVNPDKTMWFVGEADVNAHRVFVITAQGLFLAVGAIILYNSAWYYLVALAVICNALLWFIWFPVLRARIRIADYHIKNMGEKFDKDGKPVDNPENLQDCETCGSSRKLSSHVYARNRRIRNQVNYHIGINSMGEPYTNWRPTRRKLDIYTNIAISLLWVLLIIIKFFSDK